MPPKKNLRFRKKKVRKDKKQDQRIKSLEKFVYKTIENKQVNRSSPPASVTTSGYFFREFLQLTVGPNDGAGPGDPARS